MFNFGQDKNSMSLPRQRPPVILKGSLRALFLFVTYFLFSVAGGFFTSTLEGWILVSFIISLVLVFVFRKFIDRKSFESLGLRFSSLYPNAIVGLALGIFLVCTGTLVLYLFKAIEWIDVVPDIDNLFVNAGTLMLVAVSEELVFRGYVLRNLLKSFNKWLALFFSAILFASVHLANPDIPMVGILNTFLGGLLMGLTFIYTRNLWMPVFFHFAWNFLQGPVLGYPVSGLDFSSIVVMDTRAGTTISGGNYGFEGSYVCTVLLLLALIVWGYLESKKQYTVAGT